MNQYPQHKRQINKALQLGYNAHQILNKLTGGTGEVNRAEDSTLTEHERTTGAEAQKKQNINRTAGTAALAAGGGLAAYALSRAVPQIVQQVAPALIGGGGPPTPPAPPPAAVPAPQNAPLPITQQPPAPIAPPPPAPVAPTAPSGVLEVLTKTPEFAKQIDSLRSGGNEPDAIAGWFKHFNPKITKQIEKESGLPIEQLVSQYFKEVPPPEKKAKPQPGTEKKKEVKPEGLAPENQLAALPSGDVGEIESVKDGIAKINVNGEIKHRKLSDLIKEPEQVRLAINDILQIPESERSAAMDLLHYTPQHKLLHIMFPNGKIAWYEDIDEDIVDEIIAARGVPKTTGRTATGEEWTAGVPDSRFATVSAKILSNPKYSKSQEGITWGYIGKIYDKFQRLRTQPKRKKQKSD
jgi:hypothetical protein